MGTFLAMGLLRFSSISRMALVIYTQNKTREGKDGEKENKNEVGMERKIEKHAPICMLLENMIELICWETQEAKLGPAWPFAIQPHCPIASRGHSGPEHPHDYIPILGAVCCDVNPKSAQKNPHNTTPQRPPTS